MKKFLNLCLIMITLGISNLLFGTTDETITVTPQSLEFSIQLSSNPTTGYSWALDSYDHRFLTLVRHQYIPSSPQLIGSGGHEIWTFKALSIVFAVPNRTTVIKLIYARPWETARGQPPISTKIVQVCFKP